MLVVAHEHGLAIVFFRFPMEKRDFPFSYSRVDAKKPCDLIKPESRPVLGLCVFCSPAHHLLLSFLLTTLEVCFSARNLCGQ